MNTLNFLKNKKILIGIAAVVVVLIVIFASKSPKQEANQEVGNVQQGTEQQGATSTTKVSTGVKTGQTIQQTTAVTKTEISVASPANGEVWLAGKTHSIRWTHEMGRAGSIVLLDASSKEVVGWITPNLSLQQVAYDWDTSKVSLSKINPSRKEVAAGTYIIRVEFDSSVIKLDSAPFQIITSGTEKILTHEVYVRNGIFIPNYVEVQKGDKIIMINDDGNNSRTIKGGGVILAKLAQRDSYVFSVTQLGNFEFSLTENAIAKLTVVAK